jgi:serine/threonine protein kinase
MLDYNPVKRLNAAEAVRHPFLRRQNPNNDDAMGNSIQNNRYNLGPTTAPDNQNSSRLSFAENANVEELTNIQRRIEVEDFLPDEVGNSSIPISNTLIQPIGYYK